VGGVKRSLFMALVTPDSGGLGIPVARFVPSVPLPIDFLFFGGGAEGRRPHPDVRAFLLVTSFRGGTCRIPFMGRPLRRTTYCYEQK